MSCAVAVEIVGFFWAHQHAFFCIRVPIVEDTGIVETFSLAVSRNLIPKACAICGIHAFVVGLMSKKTILALEGSPYTGPGLNIRPSVIAGQHALPDI